MKNIPGRGNSCPKGPEAETSSLCRNPKKAHEGGVQWAGGEEVPCDESGKVNVGILCRNSEGTVTRFEAGFYSKSNEHEPTKWPDLSGVWSPCEREGKRESRAPGEEPGAKAHMWRWRARN